MRCLCRRKLVKNGVTAAGTQRWKCLTCGVTSIRQKSQPVDTALLTKYLVEEQTVTMLSRHYGQHPNTIRNRVLRALSIPPPRFNLETLNDTPVWVATDATHFKRWGCFYITKVNRISQPIAVSFCQRECLETALTHLKTLAHLPIVGYTTDGGRGLVLAYNQIFPEAVHQRCLVHIQMRVRALLTSQPKLLAGRDLLLLSNQLTLVKTTHQASELWEKFSIWHEQYQFVLSERTHRGRSWWYTHRNLRRAWKHIENAGDNLFVFLDHPNSMYHNNHLEGSFSQKKPALYRHRGLSRRKIAAAIMWLYYLQKH